MVRRFGILAAFLSLGAGGFIPPASAQDTLPSKTQNQIPKQLFLLTIDQEALFSQSLFGERVSAQLKQDLATLEQDFQKLETDLTAEEKQLTEKRPELSPDAFRLLADAFDEKVQGIRRAQDSKARALDQHLEQERGRYYGLINPILHDLMQTMGATVIIDRRAILVGGDGVDITKNALQLIDASLGDGRAADPANE